VVDPKLNFGGGMGGKCLLDPPLGEKPPQELFLRTARWGILLSNGAGCGG